MSGAVTAKNEATAADSTGVVHPNPKPNPVTRVATEQLPGSATAAPLGGRVQKLNRLQKLALRFPNSLGPNFVVRRKAALNTARECKDTGKAQKLLDKWAVPAQLYGLYGFIGEQQWKEVDEHFTRLFQEVTEASEHYLVFSELYQYYIWALRKYVQKTAIPLKVAVPKLKEFALCCEASGMGALAKVTYTQLQAIDPETDAITSGGQWWGFCLSLHAMRDEYRLMLSSDIYVPCPPRAMLELLAQPCPYPYNEKGRPIACILRAGLCILHASPHYKEVYWAFIFKRPVLESQLAQGHVPARYTEALKMEDHMQGGEVHRPKVVEKFKREDKVRRKQGHVYPIVRFNAVPEKAFASQ